MIAWLVKLPPLCPGSIPTTMPARAGPAALGRPAAAIGAPVPGAPPGLAVAWLPWTPALATPNAVPVHPLMMSAPPAATAVHKPRRTRLIRR
jgi:hypothetical protein